MKLNKITFLLLLFLVDFNIKALPANHEKLQSIIKLEVLDILSGKTPYVQDKWSARDLETFSIVAARVGVYGLDRFDIYALIDIECHTWNPGCQYTGNKDGSIDHGLTAQNSEWYQDRCQIVYGRDCKKWELYTVRTSIMLMEVKLRECREYPRLKQIMCYNSKTNISRYNRGKSVDYLEKWKVARGGYKDD